MNLFQLLASLSKADPEIYERLDSRRRVFRHLSGVGKSVATAVAPGLLGAIFQKAYGQGTPLPASIVSVLNFALKLEYLEAAFYTTGLNTPGLIPAGSATRALTTIRDDESKHVAYLQAALGTQAVAPLVVGTAAGNLDFTGAKGGAQPALFADVFSNYETFLAVAQSLEDTGVRAYKGAAPALMANDLLLEAALNIHSVEARHAAHLRTMRRGPDPTMPLASTPKSWISGTDGGGAAPPATAPIYAAGNPASSYPDEANVTQGLADLTTSLAALNFPVEAFSEAFDEPLDTGSVTTIALNFVVGSTF